jgi:hypothetical protein
MQEFQLAKAANDKIVRADPKKEELLYCSTAGRQRRAGVVPFLFGEDPVPLVFQITTILSSVVKK